MGLYDYINGEQVKVFFHPIYEERTKSTWHSGGSLNNFYNGDSVILKTLYYKRPKNFIVLDENDHEKNPLVHIIKNGKIEATTPLRSANNSYFDNNEAILTYNGDRINLKTKEDCLEYIKYLEYWENKYREITKEHSDIFNNRYIPSNWIISHIKPTENINKFRPDRKSKLDVIFKGINHIQEIRDCLNNNFESYDKLQALLVSDDELWNKFCDLVYPMAIEIHKASEELLDSIAKNNEPLLKELQKEFEDKYKLEDTYLKETQLGEYLECFRYMYKDKSEVRVIKGLPSSEEVYNSLLLAIKDFIQQNNGIVNSYIKWLELDEVQANNIKKIFNGIIENKEDIPVNYLNAFY